MLFCEASEGEAEVFPTKGDNHAVLVNGAAKPGTPVVAGSSLQRCPIAA